MVSTNAQTCKREEVERRILRPFFEFRTLESPLVLDALDGTETIANAGKIFEASIHSGFKDSKLNKASVATPETVVTLYELHEGATLAQMFGYLGRDLQELCLTQAQVINFCKKHTQWIGGLTFFLFKDEKGELCVAEASVYGYSGLMAYLHDFNYRYRWQGHPNEWDKSRIVVPGMKSIQELS